MAKKKSANPEGLMRPMPPANMGWDSEHGSSPAFVPAAGLTEWVSAQFIREGSALYNPDHRHLEFADIAFLWAAYGFEKQMRQVIGQTEEVTFRCGPWQKGRQEQQMQDWFGCVPKYLITLDAEYCRNCSDTEFCALVEHELYHIGQKKDDFGQPAFTKDGLPKLGIRSHDVEEFVGVVRRYGVGHPEGRLAELVKAGNSAPEVSNLSVSRACGTCHLKLA